MDLREIPYLNLLWAHPSTLTNVSWPYTISMVTSQVFKYAISYGHIQRCYVNIRFLNPHTFPHHFCCCKKSPSVFHKSNLFLECHQEEDIYTQYDIPYCTSRTRPLLPLPFLIHRPHIGPIQFSHVIPDISFYLRLGQSISQSAMSDGLSLFRPFLEGSRLPHLLTLLSAEYEVVPKA